MAASQYGFTPQKGGARRWMGVWGVQGQMKNLTNIEWLLVFLPERKERDSNKGRIATPKRMNFRKSSEGVIFNPKNNFADFCHYRRYFGHEFRKKLQYDFPKMKGGGVKGRLELFRKFIRFGVARLP